jgi:hypothetical protein
MWAVGEVAGEGVAGMEVVAMGVVAAEAGKAVASAGTTMLRIRTRLPARLARAAVRALNGGRAKGRVVPVAPLLPRVHSDPRWFPPAFLMWGSFFRGEGGEKRVYYVSHFMRRWESLFYFFKDVFY